MHHIKPRHAGGTDDPSNLIKLTIEEHANAHRKLYEQYGNELDRIAWLGLSGMIDKAEAIRLKQIEAGRKGGIQNAKLNPQMHSIGGKALWSKDGMRELLIEKRKEQSRLGKNPMQGKQQKRVCCIKCHKELGVNGLKLHSNSC